MMGWPKWQGHMTQTFAKTGLKNPENCNFEGFREFPFLSSLFSESLPAAGVTTSTPIQLPGGMVKGAERKRKGVILSEKSNSNLI